MSQERAVRRCALLFLQPTERLRLDFGALLAGSEPVSVEHGWQALAPHLAEPLAIDSNEVNALGLISSTRWTTLAEIAAKTGDDCLRGLIDAGLVLIEDAMTAQHLADQRLRDAQWHPLTAAAHTFSRWSAIDSVAAQEDSRIQSTADLIAEYGPPPPHFYARADRQQREPLPRPQCNALDALMARRATCRNFDHSTPLAQADLGALLHCTFGAQGSEELAPDAVALKKNHPSGGGLHPLEAYLIVQRVDDLKPGLYHYNAEAHALDLLHELSAEAVYALSLQSVAGQGYFAEAPVLLVVAARFARSMWKYRKHPKIYRAIVLEVGHASQNLYLAATGLGLGAFITAAINEVEIEQAFGLDPLVEGPLAVCGFGARTSEKHTIELDPLGVVWDEHGQRR